MGHTREIEQIKPWDISNPGFTHHTKRLPTFMRFLQEPDSKSYTIEMDGVQCRIRLVGPNANEIIFRCNRQWWQGLGMLTQGDARRLVEGLMHHPQEMGEKHRTRLAAQVALFFGLDR
jgi:hypothetical protein